jgi:DinB family protein
VRPCDECGFDWDTADRNALITTIASAGARFGDAIAPLDDEAVRRRPAPDVWSPLEYTAHTREALAFYDERVRRVATEDRPQLHAYAFSEAADRDAYNAEVVTYALDGLTAVADRLAARLRDLVPADWDRAGIGSEGDPRTITRLARSAAHEVQHHLLDLARQR